jgi:hypothetical protein
VKRKTAIIEPTFFAKKPPPYHEILNADFPADLTIEQVVNEIEQRNVKVRFAQSVEKAVLTALEEGKLPQLELRLEQRLEQRLTKRVAANLVRRLKG